MKTLIVYATKHGVAKEIAQRMAKKLDSATVADLSAANAPKPDGYDRVVVGSSVYAGQLRKEAKEYVAKHAAALSKVKLGLYVSGMSPNGIEGYLIGNYPKDVVVHAAAKAMLGGAFDPAHAGLFEKLVMKVVTKKSGPVNTISDANIDAFVSELNA